jgi:hypothetical protein
MTIVNIRGTHGSGKSSVVNAILTKYGAQPESLSPKGKILATVTQLPGQALPLYVVGRYETACGGCDGIQPYSDIWPRVQRLAAKGHVLFEGALIASVYGSIGTASEEYGDDFVFAYMDTPLDVCLDRIARRRAAKGNFEPVNPVSTTAKHVGIERQIVKVRDVLGRRVVVLDYNKPIMQVLKLFNVTLRREPSCE